MDILTNQEFTYRQVPVSAYTGTLDSIKGNTVVFNQLVQNGDFSDSTNNWAKNGSVTWSVSNNVLTFTASQWTGTRQVLPALPNHKVMLIATCKASASNSGEMHIRSRTTDSDYTDDFLRFASTSWQTYNIVTTIPSTRTQDTVIIFQNASSSSITIDVKNVFFIDLTQLGSSYITDYASFTSLFPLSYYSYNTGTLVSFNGTALQTIGKNQLNIHDSTIISKTAQATLTVGDNSIRFQLADGITRYANINFYRATESAIGKWYNQVMPKSKMRLSFDFTGKDNAGWTFGLRNSSNQFFPDSGYIGSTEINGHASVTLPIPTEDCFLSLCRTGNSTGAIDITITNLQLEIGETETAYSPYFTDTLSLPISTYFPTGMKSAGSVYDELTESKAITRIGAVDLGSLAWSYVSQSQRFYAHLSDAYPFSTNEVANAICEKYSVIDWGSYILDTSKNNVFAISYQSADTYVGIRDTKYSDAASFKTAMNGVYLYYELATPTETDVSLSLTYNIEPNGTEEILPSSQYWAVDLGTLDWTYNSTYGMRTTNPLPSTALVSVSTKPNCYCATRETATWSAFYNGGTSSGLCGIADSGHFGYSTTETNATTFKASVSGIILYYEPSTKTPYTSPILADITYRGLIPVSVIASPNGSGTVTGSGMYRYKQSVTLTATPNDEIYRFLRYEDENGTSVSTSSTYTFVVGD